MLIAGCGAGDDLDLSQLPLAEEEKADSPSSGEYLWTRPSATQVYCVRAPCESHMINDVNLGRIQLVYAYDLRALKLSAAEQARVEDGLSRALVYGRYNTAKAFGETVRIFQATRVNPRVSEASLDDPAADRYYTVKAGDPSCVQGPCTTYSARLMNKKDLPAETWSGIDLGRLELNQQAQQRLFTELASGDAFVSARQVSARPVPLTEAFRPLKSAPLP